MKEIQDNESLGPYKYWNNYALGFQLSAVFMQWLQWFMQSHNFLGDHCHILHKQLKCLIYVSLCHAICYHVKG